MIAPLMGTVYPSLAHVDGVSDGQEQGRLGEAC